MFKDNSEYAVYKIQGLKQVLFGKSQQFVWGENYRFAILDANNDVMISSVQGVFSKELKFDFFVEKIYGGALLGVSCQDLIAFYTWDGENCVGKIDVECKSVYWSKEKLVISAEEAFFMLELKESEMDFELVCEIAERIKFGYWYNGLFFFINENGKFMVLVR